jgi:cytochrome oxidase Cu insertion factor (SCO1/SenC/PrrC family)
MKFPISPRLTLLIIAAMFLLPLILAWLMYDGPLRFEPASTRNLGTLVEPALPIDWNQAVSLDSQQKTGAAPHAAIETLREHWVILFPVPARCQLACKQHVISLRQIHLASGRHQSRLRLALMLDDASPGEAIELLRSIYGKFTLIRDPSGGLRQALDAVRAGLPGVPAETGDTYLIDPLGNIMLHYAADTDPNHIKQDLKRLLTWSKLDEQ